MRRPCWCGNSKFEAFSPEYGQCKNCGTLVSLVSLSNQELVVHDDEIDFYGKNYWLSHQSEELGFPDIYSRARSDLTERNLHWLKTLLKYRLPPADVLELGCSHGSFVALMQQCGYQATGVEMSPWVVSLGRETFEVPIHVGPVENLDLPKGSLDVVVLMDVLEHLPNPKSTIIHCIELLKPDGFLLIQTPEFKEDMRYDSLLETKGSFLQQLKADEHLYLFSQRSVTALLKQVGVEYIYFEQAIFVHYDMFLIASKKSLDTYRVEQWEAELMKTSYRRIVLAMLDMRQRESKIIQQLEELETDRAVQLKEVHELTSRLKEPQSGNSEFLQTQVQLQEALSELQQTKAVIAAMESSKFWKIRTIWLRLKRRFGFF
jgi:2-polyprenyl-3-methyl-5-hydroxy-6-metoxy-1,4-benzoquinol methylase